MLLCYSLILLLVTFYFLFYPYNYFFFFFICNLFLVRVVILFFNFGGEFLLYLFFYFWVVVRFIWCCYYYSLILLLVHFFYFFLLFPIYLLLLLHSVFVLITNFWIQKKKTQRSCIQIERAHERNPSSKWKCHSLSIIKKKDYISSDFEILFWLIQTHIFFIFISFPFIQIIHVIFQFTNRFFKSFGWRPFCRGVRPRGLIDDQTKLRIQRLLFWIWICELLSGSCIRTSQSVVVFLLQNEIKMGNESHGVLRYNCHNHAKFEFREFSIAIFLFDWRGDLGSLNLRVLICFIFLKCY